ncbi:MAG: hypothetical protein ABL879_15805 [Devosia sp.]
MADTELVRLKAAKMRGELVVKPARRSARRAAGLARPYRLEAGASARDRRRD